jgi:putative PIN family toxin of toxin-antitoxin system
VVGREKFDRYVPLKERLQAIEDMTSVIVRESIQICRNPKDDKILELALSGQADVIITGDKDLLVLHPFLGIAILAPLDYLAL